MQYELPCIVTDQVGCYPDLVKEGITGFVLPCGNVERLAAQIWTLATDPERARRMGRAARWLIQEYTVERSAHGVFKALGLPNPLIRS